MHLVTSRQMAAIDRRTIEQHGVPGIALMHRAGQAVVDEIVARSGSVAGDRIVVLCGRGNNGGDGFVVARLLRERKAEVSVYLLAEPEKIAGDAQIAMEEWQRIGGEVAVLADDAAVHRAATTWAGADTIIDGILGTGLSGDVRGVIRTAIDELARLRVPVVAIDIPSGISGDTGQVLGAAVKATLTVTFGLPKLGQALHPGKSYCGTLCVADIGFPQEAIRVEAGNTFLAGRDDAHAWMPRREPDAHKAAMGRVLVIAGSVGMTGAAALAAESALRAGAGLVYLACPASLNDIFEAKITEVITYPVPEVRRYRCLSLRAHGEIRRRMDEATVVALGPGIGRHRETIALVRRLVADCPRPLVIDADGLYALSPLVDLVRDAERSEDAEHTHAGERAEGAFAQGQHVVHRGEGAENVGGRKGGERTGGAFAQGQHVVLTPHYGEAARLLGCEIAEVQADPVGTCQRAAAEWGATFLLKGAPTVVCGPSGETWLNPTGNPGMATGGAGDVLTGLIAGLIAQGVAPEIAARLGAYAHGLAGDLARDKLGVHGMIAGDILRALPRALKDLAEAEG